jgi:NADPH:quinone reductase-like Zn-dependent oxidoreductase
MKAYGLVSTGEGLRLQKGEGQPPPLGPHDVLVRIEAASLNDRDLMILRGQYGGKAREGLIPLSDGAGIVTAVGPDVTHWREGDRVAPTFFRSWIDGPFREAYRPSALGSGDTDGVLADLIVVPEPSLVRLPEELNIEEAATLPCAAVTAWQLSWCADSSQSVIPYWCREQVALQSLLSGLRLQLAPELS